MLAYIVNLYCGLSVTGVPLNGTHFNPPRDDTRATALVENACNMGHPPSCMVAAQLLSQRGLAGKVRARELHAQAARLHTENRGLDSSLEFGK